MRVVDVVKSPDELHLLAGSLVDVLVSGGTVRTPQGIIQEFRVEPREFSAQPGHTYLLHLLYDPLYDMAVPFQRWEISSGKLVPDDEGEFHRAQEGNAKLSGKSVDEAIAYIRSVKQSIK